MAAFTLDTSGEVELWPRAPDGDRRHVRHWMDLSPFAQGYVEAIFASLPKWRGRPSVEAPSPPRAAKVVGFSHLSPEALALILRDCEATDFSWNGRRCTHAGKLFWKTRQDGKSAAFPPVTISLSDAGKVEVRVAA